MFGVLLTCFSVWLKTECVTQFLSVGGLFGSVSSSQSTQELLLNSGLAMTHIPSSTFKPAQQITVSKKSTQNCADCYEGFALLLFIPSFCALMCCCCFFVSAFPSKRNNDLLRFSLFFVHIMLIWQMFMLNM